MEETKTVPSRAVGSANVELDSEARVDLDSVLRIERVLAERPGALTYLAHETGLQRPVVLRVRDKKALDAAGLLAPLQATLAEVAALQHPSIVPIYGFGVAEHTVWWTCQYVHAPSLADVLRSDGRLSLERTIRLAGRVAEALRHAHDRGIAHGDVSATNLLVRNADWVVLKDFVRPECWLPTVAHAETAKRSPDADQRALAITIYRCLTGDADRPPAGLFADLASAAALTARLPELSPSAVMALVRAADQDSSRQFGSMVDLVAALHPPPPQTVTPKAGGLHPVAPLADDEPLPEPPRDPERLRARVKAVAGVLLVLLGLGFTRWVVSGRGRGVPEKLASRDTTDAPTVGPRPLARPAWPVVSPRPADSAPRTASPPTVALTQVDSLPSAPTPPPAARPEPEPIVEAVPPPKVERVSRGRAPAPAAAPVPSGSARLSVSSVPGGSLYIDDRLIGPTPRKRLPVSAGRHIIRITRPGYRRYLSMIEVSPGEERRLTNLVLQRLQ